MKEYNELYEIANIILKLVKSYKKNKSREIESFIDDYLKKERRYLGDFSVNSLNQLLDLVIKKSSEFEYDYSLGLDNREEVLIYEHMLNAINSSMFLVNLLSFNNYYMTGLQARSIFNNPVVDEALSNSSFLNKYMQVSENKLLNSVGGQPYHEYYIYLPYYHSFGDVLVHDEENIVWDDNVNLFENLLDVLERSAKALENDDNHLINKKRFASYCSSLAKEHGISLNILLSSCKLMDNEDIKSIVENSNFEKIDGEFEFSFSSDEISESYDYDKVVMYNNLANNLIYNSYAIFDVMKMMASSKHSSYASYSTLINEKLLLEEKYFKSLIPEEIASFLNFLEFNYLDDYSDIDSYFDFIHVGEVSSKLLTQMSVQRIMNKLLLYSEYASFRNNPDVDDDESLFVPNDDVDSSFTQQLYYYSIGQISRKELESRYARYCSGEILEGDFVASAKVRRMLYLNVVSELLHANYFGSSSKALCDNLAYLIMYTNGLEDTLVNKYNGINYHFSYSNLDIGVSYEEVDSQLEYLISLANLVKEYDIDSELVSVFIDSFNDSAMGLINPLNIKEVEQKQTSMANLEVTPESQAIRDYIALKNYRYTLEDIVNDNKGKILERKKKE